MTYRAGMRLPGIRAVRRACASATALAMLAISSGACPAAAAQSDPAAGPLAAYYAQALVWQPCDGLECAELTVPRDYADPAAGDITIALSRARSKASNPLGTIVVNPGGPGGSGVDFTDYAATGIMPAVASRYDIVGFDPRGVGRSAPVTCMTGRQTTAWLLTDTTPDTAAEQDTLMRRAGAIGTGCLAMSGDLARQVSTDATIHDMDILRAALGSAQLDYLGFSYGTYLGARYAQEFPDRVGRFVLDGAVDPSLDSMQVSQGQSTGFQRAFARFAADCAQQASCPGGRSASGVIRWVNGLLARLDRSPMPTGRRTPLNQAQALTAIFFSLYSPESWPSLRSALQDAAKGNGDSLQYLADLASDKVGPDSYASNQNSSFYAISCWDFPAPPGADGLRTAATAWSAKAPVPELAKSMSWGNAPCSTWFGHSPSVPAPVSSTTTAPIVVVGTRYDPATPYAWSAALHRQLPTSTLLTYEGDGHTAYGAGSACIDRTIDAYFLTGAMPAAGKTCR